MNGNAALRRAARRTESLYCGLTNRGAFSGRTSRRRRLDGTDMYLIERFWWGELDLDSLLARLACPCSRVRRVAGMGFGQTTSIHDR